MKIIFLHHQRTGGSSFRHYFRHSVYSVAFRTYKEEFVVSELDNIKQQIIELEPGVFIDKIVDKCTFFSILRDPVQRCLSWIELYTRPDQSNGFSIPKVNRTLEFRKTDEFWYHINNKLNSKNNFNTNNTYIRSFINNINKFKLDRKDYVLAMKNARICDIMIFNKKTVEQDIMFLSHYYGIQGQNIEYPHMMKGDDSFIQRCPDYVIETIKQNNKYDIELFNYFNEKKDEHNFIRKMEI